MKIGIDCRMWNETGIGRFTRNIVEGLVESSPESEFVLFVLKRDYDQVLAAPNVKKVIVDIRWYTFKEQLVLPMYLYREGLDVFLSTNLNVPVLYFKPTVVTLHDLTILKVKTGRASTHFYLFYLLKRLGARIAILFSIFFAKRILTVSNFVKKELVSDYKINSNKIEVIYNAVSESFFPQEESKIDKVLEKYDIKKPYLFYVGNAHPHKNICALIEGYLIAKKNYPDLSLVLAGKKDFFYERLESNYSEEGIKYTGFVEDTDLPSLYSGSEAFITASTHEGFGLQLLEAFACGTKVICSNTTSLPEVGQDIPFYVDPYNSNDVARGIEGALSANGRDLRLRGFERVKNFSWKISAEKVLKVLNEVA
ncbi:glycosyltransferase family 4 protein [Candidatus Nomurabacteria bacterium]|uniref:Glycosyltransferase family 4 protein n=1 Tax=candidate division WWE3 bacterium TaxID=2053526 RepID=A0A955IWA8_UNCKA|nr:glycosyltransferase family 4 protein [candidate division WWE3 bacterium]MCB9824129.1 glycosyltransferase family 4 protein [Candidatus Nomurabacteria bacterium]MCB9826900.1 glycosyltransferase family 4 protein [Candidatus Nomurabacteria bacterium]MCB9828070.1 glycosyltransferase family 4 protein [Candidatus Nomurabacteria bacterium]HXK52896.1 glycosyltransferase family 1 protein [bacterium]